MDIFQIHPIKPDFKERPNNIGLFLGNISKFSSNKGHITLTLNEDLAIGDTIYTEKKILNILFQN